MKVLATVLIALLTFYVFSVMYFGSVNKLVVLFGQPWFRSTLYWENAEFMVYSTYVAQLIVMVVARRNWGVLVPSTVLLYCIRQNVSYDLEIHRLLKRSN